MSAAAADASMTVTPADRRALTLLVMMATFLHVLDSTIANVALPHMQASLGATRESVTWVLTSYIVASAVTIPLTGWLSQRLGLRRLFLFSATGFIAASVACGAAWSLETMIAFRIAQGGFGAALVPLSQTVLLNIYPRHRHGQAMALWGVGVMIGPIAGPMLGGWLTDSFDWRWVFLVNLPIGLLTLAGLAAYLPKTVTEKRPFDFQGYAYLALAIGALQMMLDRGEQLDWFNSAEILIEAGLSLAGFWAFFLHIRHHPHPILSTGLFRDRIFTAGIFLNFGLGFIMLAMMALLPPMLQQLYGYPTFDAGVLMAPRGVGTMISMIAVGRIVGRVDARLIIATGLLIAGYSLYDMSHFSLDMDRWPIIWTGFVQGIGMGLVFVPLSTIAFSTLPSDLRPEGSSLFMLTRSLGSSIGISLVVTLLARNVQRSHADLAAHITDQTLPIADPATAQLIGNAGDALMRMLDLEINRQALMIAYLDDFRLVMWMTLGIIPLLLLLRVPKRGNQGLTAPIVHD